MPALALFGSIPEPIQQALRARGFELRPLGSEPAAIAIAGGSAGTASARQAGQGGPLAWIVAICEPGDWEAAVLAGARQVVPSKPTVVVAALEQALSVTKELEALEGFRKAAALTVPGSTLASLEQAAILAAMKEAHGSTARAASMLDISVRKVQYKLHEYGMPPTRKRAETEALWGANGSRAPAAASASSSGAEAESER